MTNKKVWIGITVAIVIAISGWFLPQSVNPIKLGISCLSDAVTCFDAVNVTDGYYVDDAVLIDGSGAYAAQLKADAGTLYSSVNSTTTPASMTMRQSDFAGYSSLLITPTVGAVTMTLPASSTITTLIPSAGDWVDFTIANATSSVFAITFAGGTGTTLQQASSTLALANQQVAILRLIRLANTDILGYFSQAF